MDDLDKFESNFLDQWKQISLNHKQEKSKLSNDLDQLKQSYYLQALKIEERYEGEDVDQILENL